jgi:N-acetylmuramoyl-L-alanine amidase
MGLRIVECRSPNHDERPPGSAIDMLVLHYTGMRSAEEALSRLCDPEAKVSAHYTIDRDGRVYAHVPEERRAWHAGVSYWAGERNVNGCSIGIELVNGGHEFGYEEFAAPQIAALIDLAGGILARHPIPPSRVLGHSDVAPARKQDPGELFPWRHLAEFGIGLWPFAEVPVSFGSETRSVSDGVRFALAAAAPHPARNARTHEGDVVDDFAHDLSRFGYGVLPEVPLDAVVTAFQRHWRQGQVDGLVDEECAYRLGALVSALS